MKPSKFQDFKLTTIYDASFEQLDQNPIELGIFSHERF